MLDRGAQVDEVEVHRVGELVDIDVLKYVLLARVGDGHSVGRCSEVEFLELRVAAEIERVRNRDERERTASGGEAELCIADGSDGDSGVRVAGKAVKHLHLDVRQREFRRIYVIEVVQGNEVRSETAVNIHAGEAAEDGKRGSGEPANLSQWRFFHRLNAFIKTVVLIDVLSCLKRFSTVWEDRKADFLAVCRDVLVDIR